MLSVRMLGLLRLMLLFSDSGSECPPEVNHLTLNPPVIIEEYGKPIIVNCSNINTEHDGIYWQIGNVSQDEEYKSFTVLSLPMLEWNTDAQCRIMLSETPDCSKDLDITLYKRPDLVTVYPSSFDNPTEGKLYELQCDIVSVAPVENLIVTWYRNNQTIKTERFNKTTKTPESESSLLTLTISREDDGAEFTCVARLDLGPEGPQPPVMSNDTHTLSVHYPPEFKNEMGSIITISANKSSDISLDCAAEGKPPPQYIWTKHGVNLSDYTESLNLIQVNESTSYFCTATNDLRSIVREFHINVTETATTPAPDVMTNPRAFVPKDCPLTISPPEIVVRYGDPVSINCSATSADVTGIRWEDEETESVSDVTWTVAKLEAWNMNPVCFATLKDNSQCEKIPNIILYKTPDIVTVSALGTSGPMVHGEEFQLICNIINVAPVKSLIVKWHKNHETVMIEMFNDTSLTPKNEFSILKMIPTQQDNGTNFTCVAELHLGENGSQPVPSEISEPYVAAVDCPVTITPPEIVVRYGDPASAKCTTVSDIEGMGWEATYGGVGFTHASTVHWAVEKLEDLKLKQATCFITQNKHGQCTKNLTITVYKTPDNVSVLGDGPMVEGEEYLLKCNISDVVPADKLKVKWYRNDEYVPDMFSDIHVDPGNNINATLRIIPKKDDNGANFTCVAELHLGENGPQPVPAETSEPYTAIVHYKPVFSSCPPEYAGKEHEFNMNMVLCEADANPPAVVQWYYHETLINVSEPITRNHAGKYRAEAVNEVGESSTSVDVTVEYGPSFSCNGHDEVEENGNFHSKCQPEGIPTPDTVWYKDGMQMSFPMRWRRQDSGKYLIVATNKHGKANYSLHLNVLYAPEFKEGNYSKKLSSGENMTLDCYAEGNPSPQVQWKYPPAGNVHTTGGQQRSITVIGATSTNAGVYICNATNKVGSVTRTVTVNMKGKTSTFPQYLIWLLLCLIIILLVVILMAVIQSRRRKHGQYSFVSGSESVPLNTRSNGVHA